MSNPNSSDKKKIRKNFRSPDKFEKNVYQNIDYQNIVLLVGKEWVLYIFTSMSLINVYGDVKKEF